MPTLSRWFVRTALVWLGLGVSLGAALLVNKASGFAPMVWTLLPLHISFLLVGWALELALGVAWWLLPRLEDNRRVHPALGWGSWGLLTGGLVVEVAAQLWSVWMGGAGSAGFAVGSSMAVVGVLCFVVAVWRRVGFVPEEIRRWRQSRGGAERGG